MEKFDTLSEKDLFALRKSKLSIEIESAKRILQQGIEPLGIADKFIHNTFKLMENSISERNPEMHIQDVRKIIKKNLHLAEKIKSLKKRGEYSGGN